MAVNPSPFGPKPQFEDGNGNPAVGNKLFFYAAGSTTKQNTFTDSTGGVANANPIILNSLGQPPNEIWFTAGLSYKAVYAPSTDSDPPVSPIWTIDNIKGINDTATTLDQWVISSLTPTYVSATQFTFPGDQTSTFTVNRRIKLQVTAGTVYGYISVSAYTTLTTITVVLDSGALDSGLSAVSYGIITPAQTSFPQIPDNVFRISGSTDLTKRVALEVDGLTTATTRTMTIPDKDITLAGLSDITLAIRSYLSGCTLSTAGSSATMSIAAGQCMDSTNAFGMTLAAIAKTTSAWAVGTAVGGLDTGAIANTTWYHFYVIRRPDTGVVDVVFSTNATSPTLPANYTQYRRIGSGKTNGSAQWTAFIQDGDWFYWLVPPADISAVPTTATLRTLSVPLGINVIAKFSVTLSSSGAVTSGATHWDPTLGTTAPSTQIGNIQVTEGAAGTLGIGGTIQTRTNTASQIYNAIIGTVTAYTLQTEAWFDSRGKNA